MFWRFDHGLFGVDNALEEMPRIKDQVEQKFREGEITREDIELLNESYRHMYVFI